MKAEMQVWGIFDTKDKLWMGNKQGPAKYTDFEFARAAHTVICIMLGFPGTRLEVRPFATEASYYRRDTLKGVLNRRTAVWRAEKPFGRLVRRKPR